MIAMLLPAPGSFWHIDFAQVILILSVIAGVGKMWWTLTEFPPHKHMDRHGERAREIGDTIVSYPRRTH